MKKLRRKAKKPAKQATWGDKFNDLMAWCGNTASHTWSRFKDTAFDEEFPLALGMILTGGGILVGCLNPWTLIGILGVLVGGHKLYQILKWY